MIRSDHAFAESEDLEAAVQLRATIQGNLGACFMQTKDYAKVRRRVMTCWCSFLPAIASQSRPTPRR